MTKIAILGCGHGGQALAAHLTLKGCKVALYADPNYAADLKQIQLTNNIELTGALTGQAHIELLTTDIQEALHGSEIIYLVLITSAHESIFTRMLPFLKDGQIVVTMASNFSSLAYLALQQLHGIYPNITLVDIDSLPYACRAEQPGFVNIFAIKHIMSMSALPTCKTDSAMSKLYKYFPTQLMKADNVLALGLNITSGISHPVVAILNAGRIGKDKDKFYFYKEGISLEIAQLLERIDYDRCQIGKRLGCTMLPYLELMAQYYGSHYPTIYDFFTQSPVHNANKLCPDSLNTRYLTQDVPYLLVPWFNLGLLANYYSEALNSVINIVSQIMQQDYTAQGRTLERMGLLNKTVKQTREYVEVGL